MKKTIFPALLFGLTAAALPAQEYVPTAQDVSRFAQTKTAIVLDDNPMKEYNLQMKELAAKEWTVTPFEFNSWKTFESKRSNADYSFITLNKVTFEKDKSNALYLFMDLVLGGKAKGLSDMPDLCAIPVAYYNAEEESYLYKLSIFLRFMQQHVQLIKEHPEIAASG
jgi:hypothetical protein